MDNQTLFLYLSIVPLTLFLSIILIFIIFKTRADLDALSFVFLIGFSLIGIILKSTMNHKIKPRNIYNNPEISKEIVQYIKTMPGKYPSKSNLVFNYQGREITIEVKTLVLSDKTLKSDQTFELFYSTKSNKKCLESLDRDFIDRSVLAIAPTFGCIEIN